MVPVARYGAIAALGLTIALGSATVDLSAQEATGERIIPTNEVLITGYGTVGYTVQTQGENINAFNSSVNPIFLWQFQDKVLFEAEFEFALQGGVTETGLEYAQLDFIASNNLTLVGGKFLLPFGVFGERLHPTWINKYPTAPPIYGHHVSAFGAEPLLPVLSDLGAMGRLMLPVGRLGLGFSGYVVQGPTFEDTGEEIPELEFPASSIDLNTDKMFGGRIDFVFAPLWEVNLSYFNGDYDEENVLDFTGWNVAAEFRKAGFEVRGEYIQTRQEIETTTGFPTLVRQGFYAQAAYRWRPWEPVFRWTQIFDDKLDGQPGDQGAWQAAPGLNYWFAPSIAVMAGYEINREQGEELDNDRFIIHVAFGF